MNISPAPPTGTPPYFTVAVVSAAALADEILLLRLFSIIQWHHFAYMIISMAMLGYGASGTFLYFAQKRLLARFPAAFLGCIFLFGTSTITCFLIAQHIAFNPEEILWDAAQLPRLFILYLLLTLPFFFAANIMALTLARYPRAIARLYAFDLTGAGIGSLGIVVLLFAVFPVKALQVLACLGLSAAALAWWELRLAPRMIGMVFLAVSCLPLVLPSSWTKPMISPYKSLSQQLRITGSEIIDERSSPLGLLDVVKNSVIPLRYAPGLSVNAVGEPPEQVGIFTDGDAMTVITSTKGERQKISYLDQLATALPYHLYQPKEALILGAGGGIDILQARYFGVPHVTAVEINPQLLDLIHDQNVIGEHIYTAARKDNSWTLRTHVAEARSFVTRSSEDYDLIQIALFDSFNAAAAGLYALNESYLYTVEAFIQYLEHLSDNGYLVVSRWLKLPPRDTLKLFATAVAALERTGATDPQNRLLLIRSWQTSSLLIKNGPIKRVEIARLKEFCNNRSFDIAYYPGMDRNEANRYNILRQPYFYNGAAGLLGKNRDLFLDRYKFYIAPATDDKPYFFRFFKWRHLLEFLSLRQQGGMPLLEWGYLVLVATLGQTLLVSLILILAPVWLQRRKTAAARGGQGLWKVLVYFFAIGLAFLFIEIAFIQKFILILGHPVYAAAAVLSAFLVFAGLGSAFSRRQLPRFGIDGTQQLAFAGIVFVGLLDLALLNTSYQLLFNLADAVKISLSILLTAPLAFCMGMPFPMALSRIADNRQTLIPWAWAVNGCASVLSAVLAALFAIHFGFTAVVVLALGLYGVAAALLPRI